MAAAPDAFGISLGDAIDECRVTHEAYASYAALSVVESRYGPQPRLLDEWPQYRVWADWVAAACAAVSGSQRRYLLATAVARVCMQCPVSEAVLSGGTTQFVPSSLRQIDRPDGRFRYLLPSRANVVARAAESADKRLPLAAEIDAEGADQLLIVANVHDSTWQAWEEFAYDVLARELMSQGATVLDYDGHQLTTPALVEAVTAVAGPIDLRAAAVTEPRKSDLDTISAILSQTHEDIVDEVLPARELEVSPQDVAEVVAENSRIAGEPVLVISAMLERDLRSSYSWDDRAHAHSLQAVLGVRLVESLENASSVVWIPIAHEDLTQIVASWAGRGPVLAVGRASCLLDDTFRNRTLDLLVSTAPTFLRVDVAPDRLMRSWTSTENLPIRAIGLNIGDTAGTWSGLAFAAAREDLLWLVVGHEATVGLFSQVLPEPVERLELDPRWETALRVAITATLALEPTLSFSGGEVP